MKLAWWIGLLVGLAHARHDEELATSPHIRKRANEDFVMPQAFDASLGVNFTTTSCPTFFKTLLADATFEACVPLSFLLGTSKTFFDYEANNATTVIPQILDQSCSVDYAQCSDLMDKYAQQITSNSDGCGKDLSLGNALAQEALNGFKNYQMYYELGCLKDATSTTSLYCFTRAAASQNPTGLYYFWLGLNSPLPSGTKPRCTNCEQQLMSVYSKYADNSSLDISKIYPAAQKLTSTTCGPTFAPIVAFKQTSSTSRTFRYSITLLSISTLGTLFWL